LESWDRARADSGADGLPDAVTREKQELANDRGRNPEEIAMTRGMPAKANLEGVRRDYGVTAVRTLEHEAQHL